MLYNALLSLGFSQTPVLYNGCRSGEIFSIDVRQRNRKGQSWKATRLFHGSAVTSIHLMEAEHYLMAADMAGKVWFSCVWDILFFLISGHLRVLIPLSRADACS